ncbi:MAG TPA: hypothetical protein PK014_03910 [Thermoanaerobaculia bacterium]|nr:hypothetical protein [Thermoanaerobaculia bacterium]HUM29201.1 hypothetical protein [Thermoanaerobaculia bacterium]HXK67840.1 hypothetical protein [Thermoanaerobaculia bacterium]
MVFIVIYRLKWVSFLFACLLLGYGEGFGSSYSDVQVRVDRDLEQGKPIVVHVVVALCDNENQGIVKVSKSLGDGQNPGSNLYWGAAYGVRTFFQRDPSYRSLPVESPDSRKILERVVFLRTLQRNGRSVPVYIVADAWDGRSISDAIRQFLFFAAGDHSETVSLPDPDGKVLNLNAGGGAALIAFVGHNGLMDFDPPARPKNREEAGSRGSVVFACASKPYFIEILNLGGSFPVLLTTGLMAPEAYTLKAVIESFAENEEQDEILDAAAKAYHRYQKCGLRAARRLFSSAP